VPQNGFSNQLIEATSCINFRDTIIGAEKSLHTFLAIIAKHTMLKQNAGLLCKPVAVKTAQELLAAMTANEKTSFVRAWYLCEFLSVFSV
jgi:hypothetical protein